MLSDVVSAYENERIALIEAGTGTGKSLAYLLPAILWAKDCGEPTVISTHTIALQQQLMEKDIPFLLDALGVTLKAVLVKGMSNYVCIRKLHDPGVESSYNLMRWMQTTRDGSRASLPIAPSASLWEQIGAEKEGCTHVKCPHYKECFFFKARREVADAQILVVNHHLLLADLSLRLSTDDFEGTFVLPPYSRLILDEAHHIETTATAHFADQVSGRGLIQSIGRLLSDRGSGKIAILRKMLPDLRLDLLDLTLPAEKMALQLQVQPTFETFQHFLPSEEKLRLRDHHLKHPFWQDEIQPAVEKFVEQGKQFLHSIDQMTRSITDEKCEGIVSDIRAIALGIERQLTTLRDFVFDPLDPKRVRWVEPGGKLVAADLEVASRLKEALFSRVPTVVLCSATLSSNRSFSFVKSRLGIEEAEEKIYESPFDYSEQALLVVPTDLPDPTSVDFFEKILPPLKEVIEISRGGIFVLFTSYQMLKQAQDCLSKWAEKRKYTLLVQGDAERHTLLDQFRKTRRAILLGTDSFWEGVDVVGEALRCVVLTKLPFKVPTEPLFQARSEAIEQEGGSSFFNFALPQAVVKFKQGFGRLIRTQKDRGSVVCFDSRLVQKGYGKQFLKSLPPCRRVFEPTDEALKQLRLFSQK